MTVTLGAARRAILQLAAERGPDKTLCPSEAARLLADDWRSAMPLVHQAAVQLAGEGRIEVLQKGRPVDLSSARGPIRLRGLD